MKNAKLYIKRLIYIFIVIVVIVVVGIAVEWLLNGDDQITYRTASITRGDISQVVTASGTLNPYEEANVGTQVSGQVSALYVKANDHVKKGQLLAEIDPAVLITQVKQDQFNVDTSRINYEQAERDLNRIRMLLEKDYVAKVDLEHAQQSLLQARNSYQNAQIQLERDKVNLNYTKIYAPIDGIIISEEVTLGQTLQASYQTPNMFKIIGDLSLMKINVNLSETDIGKIKLDLPLRFTVDAFPDREFVGEIKVINMNPTNSNGAISYTVNVEVDNKEKILMPGMTAYVSIILFEKKNVLRVPLSALRFVPPAEKSDGISRLLHFGVGESATQRPKTDNTADTKAIYILLQDKPVAVAVHTGVTNDSYVEISGDGIAEGDKVIINARRTKS